MGDVSFFNGRGIGSRIVVALLSCGLSLAGCTHVPSKDGLTAAAEKGACCVHVERYPSWLVAIAEPVAPLVGRTIAHVVWREGYLAGEAEREILAQLRPLDVLLVSSKGRLSGHVIPGLFGHMAVHLGNEAELRAMGVWNEPSVRRHRDAIRDGATVIESDHKGVHLSRPSRVLNGDRVVVLRPRLSSPARRRVLESFYDHLGGRFDFHFDSGDSECVYCAELIDHVAPELHLPRRIAYGRQTIIPDDAAIHAARGLIPFHFLLYVEGDGKGSRRSTRRKLIADIEAEWLGRALDGNQSGPRIAW